MLFSVSAALCSCGQADTALMDNKKLDLLVRRELRNVDGQPGFWSARFPEYTLFVITDQDHDRMRIMIPLSKISVSDQKMLKRLLEANFDRTMDARYAIHAETLYVTYVHPLHSLTEDDFASALKQVITLVGNTGSSYTSGTMVFGADSEPGKPGYPEKSSSGK